MASSVCAGIHHVFVCLCLEAWGASSVTDHGGHCAGLVVQSWMRTFSWAQAACASLYCASTVPSGLLRKSSTLAAPAAAADVLLDFLALLPLPPPAPDAPAPPAAAALPAAAPPAAPAPARRAAPALPPLPPAAPILRLRLTCCASSCASSSRRCAALTSSLLSAAAAADEAAAAAVEPADLPRACLQTEQPQEAHR